MQYFAENRDLKLLQELEFPHDPIASLPFSISAAAIPYFESMQEQRIAPLEDFRISDSCVGDVSVDT